MFTLAGYHPRMNVVEKRLLALVAKTTGDGGRGLCEALALVVADVSPFDRGELAFVRAGSVERWPLAGDAPVCGDDLVRHIAAHPAPVRIDELHEAESFPRTHERLVALGLRSLLALPISDCGGPEGAVVIARDYGWAFAGASLRLLEPIAAMAGLCLEKTLLLSNGAASRRVRPIKL
jgi:hypothetical protein